jgi:hypothetical protein
MNIILDQGFVSKIKIKKFFSDQDGNFFGFIVYFQLILQSEQKFPCLEGKKKAKSHHI